MQRHVTSLVMVVAVLAAGSLGGAVCGARAVGPAPPLIRWKVVIADPVRGTIAVEAHVPRVAFEGQTELLLRYRDVRRHPGALRRLQVRAGERLLAVDSLPGAAAYVRHVAVEGVKDDLEMTFTVDPTYYPPGAEGGDPEDARARLTSALAIVRSSSLFPLIEGVSGEAHVSFTLPEGWVAVTPWIAEGDAFRVPKTSMRDVEYLALGPFAVTSLTMDDRRIDVAVARGAEGVAPDRIAALLRTHRDAAGVPLPETQGIRTVVVVPPSFMHGGAAGVHSVVQPPAPLVLSHELFHWWMRAEVAAPEARWLGEGGTNYYGVRAARAAGLVTSQEARACFADLSAEMHLLERDSVQSLADVSRRYGADAASHRLVYSKGTLFARHLADSLATRGRSLDEVLPDIFTTTDAPLTNEALRARFEQTYGTTVLPTFDAFVTQPGLLPDADLGEAPGTSGCARFLPGE